MILRKQNDSKDNKFCPELLKNRIVGTGEYLILFLKFTSEEMAS